MSEKRKLSDLFPSHPLYIGLQNLRNQYIQQPVHLRDQYPYQNNPSGGGFVGGFVNPVSIIRVDPVYVPPVPSFTVDFFEYNPLYSRFDLNTATSTNSYPGPDVSSLGTLNETVVLTNTTDDTTYDRLLWTVRHVDTDTYLPSGNGQTYVITPDPSDDIDTYEITLQAFNHTASGTAFLTRFIDYKRPTPAITFNNLKTTFTPLNFPNPEPYMSIDKVTTLTFVNSTVPLPSWDNSVMTLTVS